MKFFIYAFKGDMLWAGYAYGKSAAGVFGGLRESGWIVFKRPAK